MRPGRFATMLVALTLLAAARGSSQENLGCPVPIAALMSAEELTATGLNRLTPAERDALGAWLAGYVSGAAAGNSEPCEANDQAIESRIAGDFDGWVGDTIFTLQNGQIWQQTSRSARYFFANAPRVVISRAPHRMRVEGMAADVAVRRLR